MKSYVSTWMTALLANAPAWAGANSSAEKEVLKNDIAFNNGFSDYATFSRLFKSH